MDLPEKEQKAKELYRNITLYRKAGIPVNHLMAELGNLLGFNFGSRHDYEDYYNSEACRLRFGGETNA